MATTHYRGPLKNVANSSNRLGDREWYQELPIGEEPDLIRYFNDFIKEGDYATGDWTITTTEAGAGDATEAIAADEIGGALLITNDAADDDNDQLQLVQDNWKLAVGKRLWWEMRLKISDATQSDLFVGLATTDTTLIAGTTDSVSFRKADGSTALSFVTEDNTTETTTSSVHTVVADTYMKLGFYWDGISRVRAFVNRNLVATHTTNIEQTNKMTVSLALQNGEAVAKTMTIDYIYVAQER